MSDPTTLDAVARARIARTDAEGTFTDAILAASAAGHSYRTIADAAGLSFQRVAQIATATRTTQEVGR